MDIWGYPPIIRVDLGQSLKLANWAILYCTIGKVVVIPHMQIYTMFIQVSFIYQKKINSAKTQTFATCFILKWGRKVGQLQIIKAIKKNSLVKIFLDN